MSNPNLPPSNADMAKLVARVEQLERLFRNDTPLLALAEATDVGLPTDWVIWNVLTTQGPYAWNGPEQEVLWSNSSFLGPPSAQHGTAIADPSATSGHAEAIEDGWYTVNGFVKVDAVTPTAVYDLARVHLKATRSFMIGTDFQEQTDIITEVRPSSGQTGSVYYEANLPFSWTGYLPSGDTVRIYVQMLAASNPGSDWEVVAGGEFNMEKLPL